MSAGEQAPNRVARRVVIGWLILTTVALLAVGTLHIDLSTSIDFRRDEIARDGYPGDAVPPVRFVDPSPLTIWAAYDLFLWDSLRSGHLPLWERMQGGGYSPIVTFQAGILHPVRWFGVLFPRGVMTGAIMLTALSLAGLGWFLFGTSRGMGAAAAATGALLFALSPAFSSHLHYAGGLLPLAHLPWIAWLFTRMERAPSRSRFAALAIAIGLLMMAGHPLIIFVVCVSAASLAAVESLNVRRLAPLLRLGVSGIVGVALASVALLPMLVAAPDSWSYKTASEYGSAFRPWPFESWILHLANLIVDESRSVCCADSPAIWAHLGLPVLILVVLAVLARRIDRRITLLFIVTVVWLALMIPGPWMAPARSIPPIALIQPWYFSGGFAFFAALLAALAVEHRKSLSVRHAQTLVLLIGSLAVVLYAVRTARLIRPRIWSPDTNAPAISLMKQIQGEYRVTTVNGQTHRPNSSRLTGIEDVRLTSPLFYDRYRFWWWLVDPELDSISHPTAPATDQLTSPLVDDFNVRYVIQGRHRSVGRFNSASTGPRDVSLSPSLGDPEFPLLARFRSVEVRENRGAGPRAHFVPRVVPVPDLARAVDLLARERELVRHAAVVEADPSMLPTRLGAGTVRVEYPDDASVRLDVASREGGLVVLHDTWAPGWSATVDGEAVEILPVNVLSRGVVVRPGAHTIEMRYMPPGLASGAAMSALTLLGLLLLGRGRSSGVGRRA